MCTFLNNKVIDASYFKKILIYSLHVDLGFILFLFVIYGFR